VLRINNGVPVRRNLLICVGHPPFRDPRIEWIVRNGAKNDEFICVGLHHSDLPKEIQIKKPWPNVTEIVAFRNFVSDFPFTKFGFHSFAPAAILKLLENLIVENDLSITTEFGIVAAQIPHFKSKCRYFYESALRIFEIANSMDGVSTVIAADLDSLLPSAILARHLGLSLIYDAHEYWPDSGETTAAEIAFWSSYECALLDFTQARFVASQPTADYMSSHYGKQFLGIPNCEPLSSLIEQKIRGEKEFVDFLVQGGLSQFRGIELLIKAFHGSSPNTRLILRGPWQDEAYKHKIVSLSKDLWGSRIINPPSVSESELVGAASQSDIGVIPYEPININQIGACPNKLSQYMAAGIPILSNNLQFPSKIIRDGNCGISLDFTDTDLLITTINEMAISLESLSQMGLNGRDYFMSHFNWNMQSKPLYEAIDNLAKPTTKPFALNLGALEVSAVSELRIARQSYDIKPIFPCINSNYHNYTNSSLLDTRETRISKMELRDNKEFYLKIETPTAVDSIFVVVSIEIAHENPILTIIENYSKSQRPPLEVHLKKNGSCVCLSGNLIDALEFVLPIEYVDMLNEISPSINVQIWSYGIVEKSIILDNSYTQFQEFNKNNNFKEIYPVLFAETKKIDQGNLYYDMDTLNHNFNFIKKGDIWKSQLKLPIIMDTVAIFIEFKANSPKEINVRGHYAHSITCEKSAQIFDNSIMLTLSGNLTQWLEINAIGDEQPEISAIKISTKGLVETNSLLSF